MREKKVKHGIAIFQAKGNLDGSPVTDGFYVVIFIYYIIYIYIRPPTPYIFLISDAKRLFLGILLYVEVKDSTLVTPT